MLRGSYVENADHAYVARLSLSEGPAPDHVEIDNSRTCSFCSVRISRRPAPTSF